MSARILSEIAKLSPDIRAYTRRYFKKESSAFLGSCNIVTIKTNQRFVSTGEVVDKIWITLSGTVQVMEEFESGEIYIFTQFSAPEVFGEMETLANMSRYSASLVAVTDCVFLVGSAEEYLKWIRNDIESLYDSTQNILKRLVEEGKSNRSYLLLDSMERIKIYLIQHCTFCECENIYTLRNTRQQISDGTGYSVKTVNRVMKKLKEDNLIKIMGQSIVINEEQYNTILKSMDEKVNILKE